MSLINNERMKTIINSFIINSFITNSFIIHYQFFHYENASDSGKFM